MGDLDSFREWLISTKSYQKRVAKDILSRLKRANGFIDLSNPSDYSIFCLDKNSDFNVLGVSVKSQIRKSIKLFIEYIEVKKES